VAAGRVPGLRAAVGTTCPWLGCCRGSALGPADAVG